VYVRYLKTPQVGVFFVGKHAGGAGIKKTVR
jgi:hypothetical protein